MVENNEFNTGKIHEISEEELHELLGLRNIKDCSDDSILDGRYIRTEGHNYSGMYLIELNYRDGKLHGPFRVIEATSRRLIRELNYKDGKLDGSYKSYDGYGRLEQEGEFIEGREDGCWKRYYYDDQRLTIAAVEKDYYSSETRGKCHDKKADWLGRIRRNASDYSEFCERDGHRSVDRGNKRYRYYKGVLEKIFEFYEKGYHKIKKEYDGNEKLRKEFYKSGKLHKEYDENEKLLREYNEKGQIIFDVEIDELRKRLGVKRPKPQTKLGDTLYNLAARRAMRRRG